MNVIDDERYSRSRIFTRHLGHPEAMLEDEDRRLDLGIVARVVAREERDALAVQRLEARRRVGDPLAGQ